MLKKDRQISLWLFIGFLSLGQFQRIELTGNYSGINFYLHDVFIVLWLISLVFNHSSFFTSFTAVFRQKKTFVKTVKRYKFEILFVFIAFIASLINYITKQDIVALLYISRLTMYLLFAGSIRYLIQKKQLDSQTTRFQFFSAGLIILVLGLLQFTFIKDTRSLSILGWDDHFNRLISTMFDPGFTGIIFVISMLLGLSLTLFKKNRLVKALIIAGFTWGTILTFSRASYIALLTAITGLLIAKRFKKNKSVKRTLLELAMILVVISGLIFIAPKPGGEGVDLTRTASINARLNTADKQLKTLGTRTVALGNGLFSKQNSISNLEPNFGVQSHSRVPDNIFITVILSTGLIGLLLFLILITKWSKQLLVADLYIGIAFISILVHSMFNNSLLQPFVLLIFLGGVSTIRTKA